MERSALFRTQCFFRDRSVWMCAQQMETAIPQLGTKPLRRRLHTARLTCPSPHTSSQPNRPPVEKGWAIRGHRGWVASRGELGGARLFCAFAAWDDAGRSNDLPRTWTTGQVHRMEICRFFGKHSKSIPALSQSNALCNTKNGLAMFPKKTAEMPPRVIAKDRDDPHGI